MKTFIVLKHVAGMCQQATVSLDQIDGFAPHRELPEELTVVYTGEHHFWASIPFQDFLAFISSLDNQVRLAKDSGVCILVEVAPTVPCSKAAVILSERKPNFLPREGAVRRDWHPGSDGYRKPRRYDPDSR